jgi:hypothetical protein
MESAYRKNYMSSLKESTKNAERGRHSFYSSLQCIGCLVISLLLKNLEPSVRVNGTCFQAFVLSPQRLTGRSTLSSVMNHSNWPAISAMSSKCEGPFQRNNEEITKILSSLYSKSKEARLMSICRRTGQYDQERGIWITVPRPARPLCVAR